MASLLNRHPYYPQDLSLPGFVAPVMSHVQLLGIFFGGAAAVAAVVYFATGISFTEPTRLRCTRLQYLMPDSAWI